MCNDALSIGPSDGALVRELHVACRHAAATISGHSREDLSLDAWDIVSGARLRGPANFVTRDRPFHRGCDRIGQIEDVPVLGFVASRRGVFNRFAWGKRSETLFDERE